MRRVGIWGLMLGIVLMAVATPTGRAAQQGGGTGSQSGGGGGSNPDPNWRAYGNVIRGSSYYGTKAFLGLAAKGNIVIGNYTAWDDTTNNPVYEMIDRDGAGDTTRPYALPDTTDSALGYGNADPAFCGGKSPCFDGNYTSFDGGLRCAGTTAADCGPGKQVPRRFYESSLSDDVFRRLLQRDAYQSSPGVWETGGGDLANPIPCFGGETSGGCRTGNGFAVWATLYTNHALIGDVGRSGWFGAWVARDDALRFQGRLDMVYDWRLQDPVFRQLISLPMVMAPAKVIDWQEVPSP